MGTLIEAQGETAPLKPLAGQIASILDALEALYHNEANPPNLKHEEALDGLILTVLSQNTNDRNRDTAFGRLKERFPTWEAAAGAEAENLADAIRPAGLAPTKARRILTILETVRRDFGEYSLARLKERGRDAAREYLTALPGVGAKTAACVLLFDMELPAFPVDTHIGRVCRRVGFVPEKMPAEEISSLMEREVPPARFLGGHVNLIDHGRAVCRARKPLCENCPLPAVCISAERRIINQLQEKEMAR